MSLCFWLKLDGVVIKNVNWGTRCIWSIPLRVVRIYIKCIFWIAYCFSHWICLNLYPCFLSCLLRTLYFSPPSPFLLFSVILIFEWIKLLQGKTNWMNVLVCNVHWFMDERLCRCWRSWRSTCACSSVDHIPKKDITVFRVGSVCSV